MPTTDMVIECWLIVVYSPDATVTDCMDEQLPFLTEKLVPQGRTKDDDERSEMSLSFVCYVLH